MQTDPLADMLSAIQNAVMRRKPKVVVRASRLHVGVLRVLEEEGYIQGFDIQPHPRLGDKAPQAHVYLKYGPEGEPILRGVRRVSKPGRRIFRGVRALPKVLDGLGIAVLSTSRGIMSDRKARAARTGGELLCEVW
jgi:small subunit ribosomal protein S8